jgi:hypothetical protein
VPSLVRPPIYIFADSNCFDETDELWRPNAWLKCVAGQTKPSPIEDACSNCPAGRYGSLIGEGRPNCEGNHSFLHSMLWISYDLI